MTQTAQVKQILANGVAQIAVVRQGACSHNCSECGGCGTGVQPTVTALAENTAGARVGEIVTVETANSRLMGVIAFVYLVPMVFLVLGYAVAQGQGLTTGWCILAAAVCFAVSVVLICLLDRWLKRTKALQFRIVAVQRH